MVCSSGMWKKALVLSASHRGGWGGLAGLPSPQHTAVFIWCSKETWLKGKNLVRCSVLFLMEK